MDFWYPGDRTVIQINFNCSSLSEGAEAVREKGHVPHSYVFFKKLMCDR